MIMPFGYFGSSHSIVAVSSETLFVAKFSGFDDTKMNITKTVNTWCVDQF